MKLRIFQKSKLPNRDIKCPIDTIAHKRSGDRINSKVERKVGRLPKFILFTLEEKLDSFTCYKHMLHLQRDRPTCSALSNLLFQQILQSESYFNVFSDFLKNVVTFGDLLHGTFGCMRLVRRLKHFY